MSRAPRFPAALPVGLAGLLVLPACTSGGGRGAAEKPGLVREDQLSPEKREALEAWRRGGAAWEIERERVAADPELARFAVDNLILEMVRSYDRAAIATAATGKAPFDRAQAELVQLADASTEVLAELLTVEDGIVAFLAADTLRRIGEPAVQPVVRRLASGVPEVRRRTAELLGELPAPVAGEPAVLEALGRLVEQDPSWIVRAQAARALGTRSALAKAPGYAGAVLGRALDDPDDEVRRVAAEALAALGAESAVPALIRRLERTVRDGDLAGLRATQASLRKLTGTSRDLEPEAWWRLWEGRGSSTAKPGPH